MKHFDHKLADETQLRWILASLKAQAISAGRTAADVEEDRRTMRKKGRTAGQIAACEFAELRLFADMGDDSAAVAEAARAGEPSEATLALVERDGYCPDCVRRWFGTFAEAFRGMHTQAH